MKTLTTENLVLKRYESIDENDFIRLFTDAAVMKHVGDGVMTAEQARAFWRKLFEKLYPENFNIWAVLSKKNSKYVGHAGIYPRPTSKNDWEFVYFLKQSEWGKGCATEIAGAIIKFGFEELNLPEVFATIDDDHAASIRVAEKAGMTFSHYEFDEDGRFSVYSIKRTSGK